MAELTDKQKEVILNYVAESMEHMTKGVMEDLSIFGEADNVDELWSVVDAFLTELSRQTREAAKPPIWVVINNHESVSGQTAVGLVRLPAEAEIEQLRCDVQELVRQSFDSDGAFMEALAARGYFCATTPYELEVEL